MSASAGSAPGCDAAAEGVRASIGNIPAVEGLRGVAVLWVMAFHFLVLRDGRADDAFVALAKSWAPLEVVVRNGYLGVDLFFLITGFLLALPWFRHAQAGLPPPDARAFYRRRARRILPAYYVQLVFLFFVALPLLHPGLWIQSTPFIVGNLGAHATFLHYTTPLTSASLSVNGALWTLAIEAQYYLLLPLLAPLVVRWPWRSLLAAVAIAAGWRWLANHDLGPLVDAYMRMSARAGVPETAIRHLIETQLPAWSLHFGLGILAGRAWLLRRANAAGGFARGSAVVVALVALVALVASLQHGTAFLGSMGWIAYPALLASAFTAIVAGNSRILHAMAAWRPLAALGRVSYSAYLYHLPLLLLLNHFLPGIAGWIAFPFWLTIVTAVAAASYRFVEAPYLPQGAASPTCDILGKRAR